MNTDKANENDFISLYDMTEEELEDMYMIHEYDVYVGNSAEFIDDL